MSDNRQRAAEVLGFRELKDGKRYARDDLDRITEALDAAEKRGAADALHSAADVFDGSDMSARAVVLYLNRKALQLTEEASCTQ